MIAIFCVNIDAGGGLEIVSKRLMDEFNYKNYPCLLYSLFHSDNSQTYSFDFQGRFLTSTFIKFIARKFIADGISHIILQLNDPFCILANFCLYKELSNKGIKVFTVLHSSPKSFISRYPYLYDNYFIFALKKMKANLFFVPRAKKFIRFAAKKSKFIALSKGCQKEYIEYFGIKNSYVITNSMDFNIFDDINLTSKEHSVIFLGRMHYQAKNFLLMLAAWNLVVNKKDWSLRIIGNGDKSVLVDYVRNYSITNVEFSDGVPNDEALSLLKKSSILLQTSYYEGFPTVQVEAISAGNVVVTTRYDGYSDEIVESGVNGYVTDFNANHIAEKIQFLIDNPDCLEKMQKNSLEKARKLKNIDVVSLWEHIL